MKLTVELPEELEQRLRRDAKRRGIEISDYVVELLRAQVSPEDQRAEAISLLQSWMNSSEAEEQKETGEFLRHALDEDRSSERKLFPPEMEGISW